MGRSVPRKALQGPAWFLFHIGIHRHGSPTSERVLKTVNLKDRSCMLLMCYIKIFTGLLEEHFFYSLKDLEL